MRRFVLLLSVVAAVLGGLAFAASPPAAAVQSLAYEFLVPCNDADGVESSELGIDLPNGMYAVTAVGACTVTSQSGTTTVGTPCSVPDTGAIPCVSATLANIPGAACSVATTGLVVMPCGAAVAVAGCEYAINVNGQCLIAGAAWFVAHGGGSMNATFNDTFHADNGGYFLVTVVWTPL